MVRSYKSNSFEISKTFRTNLFLIRSRPRHQANSFNHAAGSIVAFAGDFYRQSVFACFY